MKYRIGNFEITPAELAEASMSGLGEWGAKFWIKRIQQARSNVYRCLNLYAPNINAGDSHSILKKELAAIGVEIVED